METGTGAIAGALAVVGLLITPLRDLASVWNFRAAYLAAREKCTAALARPQRGLYAGDERLPAAPISVRVSDLSMPRDNPLSFEVAAGAIGVSPCDTHDADLLFAALCGLEDVPADRILLSGLCLTRLSRGSLRRGVARLEARPVVLRGTLRQNLTLGLRQEPSDRRLGKQARRAGLGPLMKRIGGLDGILAEDARNLSDHERSALALARILLSKPGLVLVGTALLHLDTAARDAFWAHVGALGSTILQHPDLQEVRNTGRVIPARVPPDA